MLFILGLIQLLGLLELIRIPINSLYEATNGRE